MADPAIPKNEGLFDAVTMIVPEGCVLQPRPGKPAALGAFHPAVEVGEAICVALSSILPERAIARRLDEAADEPIAALDCARRERRRSSRPAADARSRATRTRAEARGGAPPA